VEQLGAVLWPEALWFVSQCWWCRWMNLLLLSQGIENTCEAVRRLAPIDARERRPHAVRATRYIKFRLGISVQGGLKD